MTRIPLASSLPCSVALAVGMFCQPAVMQAQPSPQNTQQQQPYPQQQQQYPQQQYPQQQPYPQQQQQYPQQQPYPQQAPPVLAPQQLDPLVQSIALYPDPLLAQVLTASTYSNEIPDAATWAVRHSYLTGEPLARAIEADNLPWDPSVIALLPFSSVLDQMARDMSWTQALGNAVLAQRGDVMDAVQRMRQEAMNYGYLRTNPYSRVVVVAPGQIEIVPARPDFYYVPAYEPSIVFFPPRPGFYVGGAIRFGSGIGIGAAFAPWGWGGAGFVWRDHAILLDHRPWGRTWTNRRVYAPRYAEPRYYHGGPPVERHDIRNDHNDRGRNHDHDHGRRDQH